MSEMSGKGTLHSRNNPLLTDSLTGGPEGRKRPAGSPLLIGILEGEGVGPELIGVVTEVLDLLGSLRPVKFTCRKGGDIGLEVERRSGVALPEEVSGFCESIFKDGGALLCGPGGGRFVYELRARFDLFCKFTPVRPIPALQDTGVIRPEALRNVDMVIVRENVSGLYFSESRLTPEEAVHTFRYRREEVDRVMEVAIRLAKQRRGRLTLAVKGAAVNAASRIWLDSFRELTAGSGLETRSLEVDNANYQIIADARSFDVLVTPNMFGDILADGAALLLGSRGMSFSGNFSGSGTAVYQTAHGAAYDLAGTDTANPIGQVLTTAMLLRESYGLMAEAAAIEAAVAQTLASGIRTADIAAPGSRVVGTRELGRMIGRKLEEILLHLPLA